LIVAELAHGAYLSPGRLDAMGNKRRPAHAGLFHVTARSIAEEHIFRDARDFDTGVRLLAQLTRSGVLVCHEFCFMSTHYHVLGTFGEGALPTFGHRLNRRYAAYLNERYDRRGHVFDSPFVTVEVVEEAHGLGVHQYIADNPPKRPWPWSSFDQAFPFVEPLDWAVEMRRNL
jgi:putative transposase